MHATIQAFWLPKAGNSASEYEDAFWPTPEEDLVSLPIRLAVGDGATATSFSALWAKLLVQDHGEGFLTEETLVERLPILRDRWLVEVSREPLPWYAEEKLRSGAFSSFLGLTIEQDSGTRGERGRWRALAIGDSCLFHVRNNERIVAWPMDKSDQFNDWPVLIPSVSGGDESFRDAIKVEQGSWEMGDVFYLMTDALACWFLRRLELKDGDPFEFLNRICDDASFEEFIRNQRADSLEDGIEMLKNDDVTLVRCRIEAVI